MMPRSSNPVQQEARDGLARAARRYRALRGSAVEKELTWEPGDGYPIGSDCFARVGKGRLILTNRPGRGVNYTASFGPNSDMSFSGYLPGLTLEEAKRLVYHDWRGYR